jgi:homoserine dehydrogenase
MKTVTLVLAGYGHVGRAFTRLIRDKRALLLDRYDLDLSLKAVIRHRGGRVSSEALEGRLGEEGWDPGVKLDNVLRNLGSGVLVECLPSSLTTGEPALSGIRRALGLGWHVAAASKGPLVVDFRGLVEVARQGDARIRYSAATGAALPTVDVGRASLAGAEILRIEGILNGTSNYILTRMSDGQDFEAALAEAQAKGIAEPDPRNDIEGWDAAAKLVIITNSVLETSFTLDDVRVEGLADFLKFAIGRARNEGQKMKLLARLTRRGEGHSLSVTPEIISLAHPLFGVDGTNKGLTYYTDSMGAITLLGGQSDPRGAAAALLKDVIGICRA